MFLPIACWSSRLKGRGTARNVVAWICMSWSRHPKGSSNHQDERKEGMSKIWGGKHQTCGMTKAVSQATINSQLEMDEFRLFPSCSKLVYQHTLFV